MHDPRFDKLAKLLVEYSTRLKKKENVLIEAVPNQTPDLPFDVADQKEGVRQIAKLQTEVRSCD